MERLHRTLKISLICKKIDEGNNFDIIRANDLILFNYNNTIHITTQFKPIEIFYTTSEDIKNDVYMNTLNSFKHLNVDHTIFSIYEKVLLYSNFIIDNLKSTNKIKYLAINKVKKKKTFYKLCASVCENFNNGFYKIIIEKNYKFYNLNIY